MPAVPERTARTSVPAGEPRGYSARAAPRHGLGGDARIAVPQVEVAVARDSAEVGVFGGSGFYSLLDDVREVKVDTPYGPPSDSVFLAELAGRRVAFLPRHGRRHHRPRP